MWGDAIHRRHSTTTSERNIRHAPFRPGCSLFDSFQRMIGGACALLYGFITGQDRIGGSAHGFAGYPDHANRQSPRRPPALPF